METNNVTFHKVLMTISCGYSDCLQSKSRLSLGDFYIFKVSTLINLMMLSGMCIFSQFKPIQVLVLGESKKIEEKLQEIRRVQTERTLELIGKLT